jgi:hypothetical protein
VDRRGSAGISGPTRQCAQATKKYLSLCFGRAGYAVELMEELSRITVVFEGEYNPDNDMIIEDAENERPVLLFLIAENLLDEEAAMRFRKQYEDSDDSQVKFALLMYHLRSIFLVRNRQPVRPVMMQGGQNIQ